MRRAPIEVAVVAESASREPWLTDIATALAADGHTLRTVDPSLPLDRQFDGIRVVLDLGGHGTRPMIDAAAAAGVELWQALTTGLDHTEVDHILGRGLTLTHTPGEYSAVALAEHALMLMLTLTKQLHVAERHVAEGRMNEPMNDELDGRTLGLVGLGWSARELARRAGALGMRVRAIDVVTPSAEQLGQLTVERCYPAGALDELLAWADVLSLHVPLTDDSRGMIGAAQLALMKPTALLVNVARGGLVDEVALREALEQGQLAGAGLDAFVHEPPDPSDPLLALPNVVATPHVAGVTRGTSRRRAAAAAENVRRLYAGEPLLHEVRGR